MNQTYMVDVGTKSNGRVQYDTISLTLCTGSIISGEPIKNEGMEKNLK